jgi:aspartyl-tRNA synthetase
VLFFIGTILGVRSKQGVTAMKRTFIKDVRDLVGTTVKVCGWVQTLRDQKRMQFMVLRDQTGMVQVAAEQSEANAILNCTISSLIRESAVEVVGKVVENPVVKLGGVEIQPTYVTVANLADRNLPIPMFEKTEASLDARLDWRYLDLRRPDRLLIFKVQTTAEMAMREFWLSEGFIEIHSPKLMGSPSESGAELFSVEYFGRPAYLAQSPQFYKQMAMAAGFDRVFEVGPVFRANPSFTSRHDTEFTSVDMEISWIDSHDDVMSLEERWLQHVLTRVREKHGEEISSMFGTQVVVPSIPFPRITMREASAVLAQEGYTPPDRQGDLDPEGERLLSTYIARCFNHEFVFLTEYPVSVRPFYHMRCENDPSTTKSFDLLWKGLEVTTGAQREHRLDVLERQAIEKGLSLNGIRFYLDFFKYGCPPHGGLGFGLTRMLMSLFGVGNVREVTYLYRGPNRVTP